MRPKRAGSQKTLSPDADYRAAIKVQRFESAPGEAVTLDEVWTVSRAKAGRSQTGRTTVRELAPERGDDALAAAHSRAGARLSRDIADAVPALDVDIKRPMPTRPTLDARVHDPTPRLVPPQISPEAAAPWVTPNCLRIALPRPTA